MHISSTELNKRPGAILEAAMKEPVIVEKSGNPAVVMVSYQRYQDMEDVVWGILAKQALAENDEILSPEETEAFLRGE